jgi:hypothetical protein
VAPLLSEGHCSVCHTAEDLRRVADELDTGRGNHAADGIIRGHYVARSRSWCMLAGRGVHDSLSVESCDVECRAAKTCRLEGPSGATKLRASCDPDIWVLIETHTGHQPTATHRHSVFCPPCLDRQPPRPSLSDGLLSWSRWPLVEVMSPKSHRRGSVATVVATPFGPLIVYGAMIAWSHETFD